MSRISAAVLVMATMAGCHSSNLGSAANSAGSGRSPQGAPQMHVHANGLQLSVSEAYRVSTTPKGFVLTPASPSNNDRRDPLTVSIQLLATPPQITGYRERRLSSERVLSYTASHEEEGGSSGVNWTMVAFEHVGDHWIQYQENKLAEREPDELWGIAGGSRYIPAK
jgi:hypothetical protein